MPRPMTRKPPRLALDPVAALAARAVDAVLGLELGAAASAPAAGAGAVGQRRRGSAARSSSRPSPVAEETASTPSDGVAEPLAPVAPSAA